MIVWIKINEIIHITKYMRLIVLSIYIVYCKHIVKKNGQNTIAYLNNINSDTHTHARTHSSKSATAACCPCCAALLLLLKVQRHTVNGQFVIVFVCMRAVRATECGNAECVCLFTLSCFAC